MPQSGYPIEMFLPLTDTYEEGAKHHEIACFVEACAQRAIKSGLFIEWLESFVGAYNNPAKDATPEARLVSAANAGIVEWDL